MKLRKKDGSFFWITFKYERLHTFCYFCGILGHSMQFCRKLYGVKTISDEPPYGAWLRVKLTQPRNNVGARWIVEEGQSERLGESAEEDVEDRLEDIATSPKGRGFNSVRERIPKTDMPEEALPTFEFKRCRSSEFFVDMQTNLQCLSVEAVPNCPASPARQACPNQ